MRRALRSPILLVTLLAACSDDAETGASATSGEVETETDTDASAGAPTYYGHAKAILDAACVSCHSPDNIAPFSLKTYAEASMFAPVLAPAIEAGTMPPWPPDSSCRAYVHDRSLAADEAETLLAWIEAGALEGDPADAPEPPAPDGAPIDYDVEILTPGPYTPTLAPDEYRCFVLEWPEVEDRYVTAFLVEPGSRSIVHHVIAYAAGPEDVDTFRALDEADPDPGYVCFGGPGARAPWLGAWVPGSAGGAMAEGTGLHVAPGSAIVVQMHYHTYAGAPSDTSRLLMRTAASVEHPAAVLPFANPKWPTGAEPMTIPAGDPDASHSFRADVTKALPLFIPDGPFAAGDAVRIQAAGLHQHTLGTRSAMRIHRGGGGEECLIDIPRWDFNWQGGYQLAEPIVFNPGDELEIECHWDNSAANQPYVDGVQLAPVDVGWGEGTGDEMCLGIVTVSTL